MSVSTEVIPLSSRAPGSRIHLTRHRFVGVGSTRSAYIQAGLHADEHPGLLVTQHLLGRLQELDQQNRILGEIVVCPYANPVGLGQNVLGCTTGRFDLANGENFNRNFPDVTPALSRIISVLADQNLHTTPLKKLLGSLLTTRLKKMLGNLLDEATSLDAVAANKRELLREAFRHDLVLDLHCDTASVLHLYSINGQRERALKLAGCMNIKTVFLEDAAGGQPFDESYNKPWQMLVDKGLAEPAQRGFAASIELRGQADVDDELARQDAEGILRFLALEGLLVMEVAAPNLSSVQAYPLEGASHLQATGTGLLVWKKSLGDPVVRDEMIAEIVPLDAPLGAPRLPVFSDTDGLLVVQPLFKLVRMGQRVALLAGKTPLANRVPGQLLQHF